MNSESCTCGNVRPEAAHQGQPVVERELARVVSTDDVDLVEVRPGLERLGKHLVGRHPDRPVGLFALVGRERTELAVRVADVRRVDVAVEDVEDLAAALAQLGGQREPAQRMQVACPKQRDAVLARERDAGVDLLLDGAQGGVDHAVGTLFMVMAFLTLAANPPGPQGFLSSQAAVRDPARALVAASASAANVAPRR